MVINMKVINEAEIKFAAISGNEAFARGAITAFLLSLDPSIADLSDVKTALSEAVTNAIIHGYKYNPGMVHISIKAYKGGRLLIKVKDKGCGIEDINRAMEPLYTTGGDEQAGIGFAVMESFCDELKVRSAINKGTTVTLVKQLELKNE